MIKYRESERRCTGRHAEYPGAYAWPDYEYLCPHCKTWGSGSNVSEINDDGTDSILCEKCAEKIDFTEPANQLSV